jgi:hypothetical protein
VITSADQQFFCSQNQNWTYKKDLYGTANIGTNFDAEYADVSTIDDQST